jgi:hypothetical protein
MTPKLVFSGKKQHRIQEIWLNLGSMVSTHSNTQQYSTPTPLRNRILDSWLNTLGLSQRLGL